MPAGDALPFPDGSFDAVLAFEVLEHVEDDTGLLDEIARVSRPGGVLILSTPVHASMWSPLDDACGHVRRDEPEVLFEKVRAAGFEIGGYSWTAAGSSAHHEAQSEGAHLEPPSVDGVRADADLPVPRRLPADVREARLDAARRSRPASRPTT